MQRVSEQEKKNVHAHTKKKGTDKLITLAPEHEGKKRQENNYNFCFRCKNKQI